MAAFDEQDYTKSFDWGVWKRLGPVLSHYKLAFVGMLGFNALCSIHHEDRAVTGSQTSGYFIVEVHNRRV